MKKLIAVITVITFMFTLAPVPPAMALRPEGKEGAGAAAMGAELKAAGAATGAAAIGTTTHSLHELFRTAWQGKEYDSTQVAFWNAEGGLIKTLALPSLRNNAGLCLDLAEQVAGDRSGAQILVSKRWQFVDPASMPEGHVYTIDIRPYSKRAEKRFLSDAAHKREALVVLLKIFEPHKPAFDILSGGGIRQCILAAEAALDTPEKFILSMQTAGRVAEQCLTDSGLDLAVASVGSVLQYAVPAIAGISKTPRRFYSQS